MNLTHFQIGPIKPAPFLDPYSNKKGEEATRTGTLTFRNMNFSPCLFHALLMRLLFLSLLIVGSASLNAALPDAAQEPFNKGMSAVQQQDFSLALRYFNDAHRLAPNSPEVLFNLGLAEAQVPGRELRAVCWFESYLLLMPDAANASAIHQQISALEIRAEENVRKIIEVMKTLAGKFPTGDSSGISDESNCVCAGTIGRL